MKKVCSHCLHKCRQGVFSLSFWAGVTVSFPLEHGLWEKIWPFELLTKAWHL